MKKVLLGTAATAMAVMLAGSAMATPASTFSGHVNGAPNLAVIETNGASADSATILSSTLKVPGSKKDLLIGVSLESGVITQTKVKGKNGETDLATAEGSVTVTVYIDGVEVAPGPVTFNHRKQELEATFGGVIESCTDGDGDGTIIVADDCVVTDEMIRLLLETTSANHFNFIAPNVGQGEHTIEVEVDVTAAASGDSGANNAEAVVNVGSLSVEVVRSANTDDGIVVE